MLKIINTSVPEQTFKVLTKEKGVISMSAFVANLLTLYTDAISQEATDFKGTQEVAAEQQ